MSASFDPKFIKFSKVTGSSLLSGLRLWYNCNESSGNITDSSGNGYTGVATALTYGQAGKVGNSLYFNGTSSKVIVGSGGSGFPTFTTGFSISFWIKTNWATDNCKWLSCTDGTYGLQGFYYTGGGVSLELRDGTNNVEFGLSTAIGDNAWHHIVFTFDGTNINGYVDGSNALTNTWAHTLAFTNVQELDFMFSGYDTQWVQGNLDMVGLWNRALTSDERTTLYNSGNGTTYPF